MVSWLTEIVWRALEPWITDAGLPPVIEGDSFTPQTPLADGMPHPADQRYPSHEGVMRLLHVVGGAENLFAAYFLGEVEKITGPVSVWQVNAYLEENPLPAGVSV